MTSGNTTPMDQDQKKRSGLLAGFIFASFILAMIGSLFIHPALDLFAREGFRVAAGVAFAFSIVFGVINLETNASTNDGWKAWIGWFVVIYNIVFAALYISQGA